jgi:branched-chain amino acid transport system ATP-binding protein
LATDPLLRVVGLVAGYGRVPVLRGVDFHVDPGEVVTLLGANGSGKSTALNTISGFLPPLAGRIELDGQAVAGRPPHRVFRLGIVQVSQSRDLFPDMSVEDNLGLGAAVRGDAASALPAVYDVFPRLAERRHQRVRTMSGGEQQMVALGRALMSRPRLLLLDEPSGGLAPRFVEEIAAIIRRLKDAGTTMLMVEQNIRLAFRLADRFIVLRDGRIVEAGRVADLAGAHDDVVRRIYL